MKKQTISQFFAIILIAFISTSCLNDDDVTDLVVADSYPSLGVLVQSLKPAPQVFTIDPTIAQTVTGEDGTVIEIAANTFTDSNNDPITSQITVKLKEHLTLKDMLMANAQTESNGQLLVTGGSFNLTFEDEDGDDVNANPWNIQSKIPVQTDITGYENSMQYFVGDSTTVDGKEVVNWNQGQAEAWMQDGIFNTIGIEQGLSNCDVLYDMTGDTPTQFEATITGVTDYTQATVWMVIEDFPSIVMIYTLNGTNDALTTYANSIPTGLNATLVAINVDANNYLQFGSLPITVTGDDTFNINVSYGTTAQLGALINSL